MNKIGAFLENHRDRWWFKLILVMLGLVVLLVILDKLVMPFYVKLGDETEMPDVIEMHVDEARSLLENQGFNVFINDSLYDANHPENVVIEQNPYPYARVKEGRRVYLSISIGEKPIIMPNLFSVSPREAELILETNSLKLKNKNYVYSDIYHEGTVIGQSYPQGQVIKPGSGIDITISLGKLREELIVPDLIGKSLYEARARLREMQLKIGEIIYEERENILPETILKQSLPAGDTFDAGDTIDLTVSKEKL